MNALDLVLEPLRHGFMVKAMLIGAFVCAVCAALSCFIVLKGWSLVGDAISHAVLPGIVLAHIIGVPLALGAVASGILCVQAAGGVARSSRIHADAALGICFTGFLALGIVLVTAFPGDIDFTHILFGNLLGITDANLLQAVVLGALALLAVVAMRRDLVLFCFDPVQAQAVGLSPRRLEVILLLLVATVAVASLQVVGLALILAMLITPGCFGLLVAKRFDRMLAAAMGSAVVSAVLGTMASFHLDGATGPCIVLVQALVFALAFALSPRGLDLVGSRRDPASPTAEELGG